jgi:single-strand DNA-binding protein
MAYLNKTILIGNLCRDPELRVTSGGTPIANFSIALNRKLKSEAGELREEVTFVEIEAWGKQAELCSKYLMKGSPAMIEGRLKLDQWEDKQTNEKRSRLKVVLENVQFLGTRESNGQGQQQEEPARHHAYQQASRPAPAQQPRRPAPAPPSNGDMDEDVPF